MTSFLRSSANRQLLRHLYQNKPGYPFKTESLGGLSFNAGSDNRCILQMYTGHVWSYGSVVGSVRIRQQVSQMLFKHACSWHGGSRRKKKEARGPVILWLYLFYKNAQI